MPPNDSILSKVHKMPIVADFKFRRFFAKDTPEARHIIEELLKVCIPGIKKIKRIISQKHVYDDNQSENVTDLEVETDEGEEIWIEMQRWNKNKDEIALLRWEKLRLSMIENHKDKKCFLVVLFDTREGGKDVWGDFLDRESSFYSMADSQSSGNKGESPFPSIAKGVIILMNINKLSERKDEVGDICRDLLTPGGNVLTNSAMEKQRKKVFSKKVEEEMCQYVRDIVDSEKAELIARNEDLTARNEGLTNTVIFAVNSMRSKGMTDQEIAVALHLSLSEVKAI